MEEGNKRDLNYLTDAIDYFVETLFSIFLGAIVMVMYSFVIMKLWNWIAVPVFDVVSISLGAAFGIHILVTFLKANKSKEKLMESRDSKTHYSVDDNLYHLLVAVILSIMFLFFGWIASLLV